MNRNVLFKTLLLISMFMLGLFSSTIYAKIVEKPTSFALSNFSDGRTDEIASPSDWVKESQIGVYSSNIILDIKNAEWASFTDTHSMEPVLSSRANAIEIVPKTSDEVNVGDIVSYKSDYADGTIIHRVIEKSYDDKGVYFIMKGDNNPEADPEKIRFSQLQRVVIAVIY